jgi:Type I phosphodiesterase / nucleotide pyrophosphatase
MTTPTTLMLELNEVNFEYVERYIAKGLLPNFKSFLSRHGYAETTSEANYDQLEPWIQWVTAHTGQSLAEHGVFRLGDIVDYEIDQIWDQLARNGVKVGAVSPMNAKCAGDQWDFFVPDPWTNTKIIAPPAIKRLYEAIAQVVNDNAQSKVTATSVLNLAIGGFVAASPKNYLRYLSYLRQARSRPWLKAIFLDQLLADLFVKSVSAQKTQFATLFLNAAAHIQHHYMFSSDVYHGEMRNPDWYIAPGLDPLLDVYSAYDRILGDVQARLPHARIMLATGLHQDPHPDVTFYWRLKNHADFLARIGVSFLAVEPRMSRDFLIRCTDAKAAVAAEMRLNSAVAYDGLKLFDVDNRGSDLFVMLIYPADIGADLSFSVDESQFQGLADDVAFVAIKNGRHNGIGYFADSGALKSLSGERFALKDLPVRILHSMGVNDVTPTAQMAA